LKNMIPIFHMFCVFSILETVIMVMLVDKLSFTKEIAQNNYRAISFDVFSQKIVNTT
jgi:hypothetical protein